jgi:subtilase family serine protease
MGTTLSALSGITAQFSAPAMPLASPGMLGYSPQQIQSAYAVSGITFSGGSVAGNGAGQTIAIVDAYNDPSITSDLANFDSRFGLPAPPSFAVENLGGSSSEPGWALETALDVEWAHSLAPSANIVLVEAASTNLSALVSAVNTASNSAGVSVVSMSWGTQEFSAEARYDPSFTHPGVTYVASSGDASNWSGPSYPSVSPNVLAVGGTTLTLAPNGSYGAETAWSGSGGGFSAYEPAPSYQVAAQQAAGLNVGVRTTPDVSFNANPNTGLAVYNSVPFNGQSGWTVVGGTSAAAPAWAGLISIADQGLAASGTGSLTTAQVQNELYSLPGSDFHAASSGSHASSATAGYDLTTGLGSPKADLIVASLVASSTSGGSGGSVSRVTVSSPSSHSTGSSTGHHMVVTPPSAIDVTGPALASSPQQIGTVPTQTTTSVPTTSSATSAAQSAAAAAATSAQSSAAPTNSLGQSLTQQSPSDQRATDEQSPPVWFVDEIAQAQATSLAPGEKRDQPAPPVGDLNQNPKPNGDQNQEHDDESALPPPAAASAIPLDKTVLFDAAPGPIGARSADHSRPLEWSDLAIQKGRANRSTSWGVSTVVGTVSVAAGGYWLTLRDADRKRRWLIPGRVSRI